MTSYEVQEWAEQIERQLSHSSGNTLKFELSVRNSLAIRVASLNEALSRSKPVRQLALTASTEMLSVSFEGRCLRVVVDTPANKVYYVIVNEPLVQMSKSNPRDTNITSLQIAKIAFGHRLLRHDGSLFSHDSLEWPAADQLITFLLQKLLLPEFVDDRFEPRSH